MPVYLLDVRQIGCRFVNKQVLTIKHDKLVTSMTVKRSPHCMLLDAI